MPTLPKGALPQDCRANTKPILEHPMRNHASPLRPSSNNAPKARIRKRAAVSALATAAFAAAATIGAPAPLNAAAPAAMPTATTAACNPLPFNLPAPENRHTSAKKAWAYYFPPFPLAVDSPDATRDVYPRWMDTHNSINGAYDLRDRPQAPQRASQTTWRQADFEKEVRQAVGA